MKQIMLLILVAGILGCNHPTGIEKKITIGVYSGPGADAECTVAAEHMFHWMNYTTERISYQNINNNSLGNYYIIFFPGGDMYEYSRYVNSAGKENIRAFVRDGGGYLGICGGGYFAAEAITWRGQDLCEGLSLFHGEARGPMQELVDAPVYGMTRVNITDHGHPITQSEPDSMMVLYYWGPAFHLFINSDVSQLAHYSRNGLPAMVAFTYGSGRVFLSGPHPEFEEDDSRDGVSSFDELEDEGSEWELMRKATQWVRQ